MKQSIRWTRISKKVRKTMNDLKSKKHTTFNNNYFLKNLKKVKKVEKCFVLIEYVYLRFAFLRLEFNILYIIFIYFYIVFKKY